MCMLIISDRWKNEGVCMRLLRYMWDNFLELDTLINDDSVRGKINKSVSLHTNGVSNKDTLSESCAFLFSEGIWAHAREPEI
jgi:hypothetical protein